MKRNSYRQDMGYAGELKTFFDAVMGKHPFPIPLIDYVVSTLTTLKILESLSKGVPVPVNLEVLSLELNDAHSPEQRVEKM